MPGGSGPRQRPNLIDVDGVEVRLTTRGEGDSNWVLDLERQPSDQTTDHEDADTGFRLQQINAENIHIVIESPGRTRPLDIQIESLDQWL